MFQYFLKTDWKNIESKINDLEKNISKKLPENFREILLTFNGLELDVDKIHSHYDVINIKANTIYFNKEVAASFRPLGEEILAYDYHRENRSEYMISKSLIFFGSDGAGRYFCFDYALEKNGKVPVVIVMPDADAEERGRYIADDFSKFLEMLGNPEIEAPYYAIEYPYIENGEL